MGAEKSVLKSKVSFKNQRLFFRLQLSTPLL
jgi:hypothetical protein